MPLSPVNEDLAPSGNDALQQVACIVVGVVARGFSECLVERSTRAGIYQKVDARPESCKHEA